MVNMVRRIRRSNARRPRRTRRNVRKYRRGGNRVRSAFMPSVFKTKLRFTERTSITMTTGAASQYLWRLNSVYDPDYSGVGGVTALGHTTLSNIYAKYTVHGAKWRLRIVQSATTATTPVEIGAVPVTNGVASITPEEVRTNPRGKFKILGNNLAQGSTAVSGYTSVASLFGEKRISVESDDLFSAAVSGNPSNVAFLNLSVQPTDHASTVTVRVYADIIFYVSYHMRKEFNSTI